MTPNPINGSVRHRNSFGRSIIVVTDCVAKQHTLTRLLVDRTLVKQERKLPRHCCSVRVQRGVTYLQHELNLLQQMCVLQSAVQTPVQEATFTTTQLTCCFYDLGKFLYIFYIFSNFYIYLFLHFLRLGADCTLMKCDLMCELPIALTCWVSYGQNSIHHDMKSI